MKQVEYVKKNQEHVNAIIILWVQRVQKKLASIIVQIMEFVIYKHCNVNV